MIASSWEMIGGHTATFFIEGSSDRYDAHALWAFGCGICLRLGRAQK